MEVPGHSHNPTRQFLELAVKPPSSIFTSLSNRNRYMADQKKQEKDFTSEVDTILPEATTLAKVSCIVHQAVPVLITCTHSPVNSRMLSTKFLLSKNKHETLVYYLLFTHDY